MSRTVTQRATRTLVLAAALLGSIGAATAASPATTEEKAATGAYASYLISRGLDRAEAVRAAEAVDGNRTPVKAVARSDEGLPGAYASYLISRGLDRADAVKAAAGIDPALSPVVAAPATATAEPSAYAKYLISRGLDRADAVRQATPVDGGLAQADTPVTAQGAGATTTR